MTQIEKREIAVIVGRHSEFRLFFNEGHAVGKFGTNPRFGQASSTIETADTVYHGYCNPIFVEGITPHEVVKFGSWESRWGPQDLKLLDLCLLARQYMDLPKL